MIRALLMELERWNNSRAVVCHDCGPLAPGRIRAPLAYWVADHHEWDGRNHSVKVKRFG